MRFSYNGDLCTVRFRGHIPVWETEAFGVEWDEPERGKNDGTLDGVRYFQCRLPGSGSFVKVTKPHDPPCGFQEALTRKYIREYEFEMVILDGEKVAQPIGLDKFQERQKDLRNVRIVSLVGERISDFAWSQNYSLLRNMWRLDLTANLFENLRPLCDLLQNLAVESLTLNANRFTNCDGLPVLSVSDLSVAGTLVTQHQIELLLKLFPNTKSLGVARNLLDCLPNVSLHQVERVDASWNRITTLKDLNLPETTIVSHNDISELYYPVKCVTLDISHQSKELAWSSIDWIQCKNLTILKPTNVRPFVIARIPGLERLDGILVSVEERRDSEIYTLSQISQGKHLNLLPQRWQELVEMHGVPNSHQVPGTIAARLINIKVDGVPFMVLPNSTFLRLARLVAKARQQEFTSITFECQHLVVNSGDFIRDWLVDGDEIATVAKPPQTSNQIK